MKYKKFSVLLSVYIKENKDYLNKALSSVFNQTVIPSEVVLVEDGPLTDELDKVIKSFEKKFPKILKVVKYKENRGLGIALRDGLLECSNELIFRMDTDDICMNNRFEKQLEIFNTKDIDIVGSTIVEYDETMNNVTTRRIVPETNEEIRKTMKSRNPMNHMTIGYKKSAVIEAGNYQDMLYFEDYYLWVRMMKKGYKFYNIQESLVNVRGGNDMIKRRGGKKYIKPIINFEKGLLKLGIINTLEYIKNVSERVIVSLMPNGFRFFIYKKILRK